MVRLAKNLCFVTTNLHKFKDVQKYLSILDAEIELEQISIDIVEPQSLDIKEIAIFKAQEAWKYVKKPLIIDDGGLFLEKYNKFPGALSKYVFRSIGLDGIWKLAQDDPRAYFESSIVYIDNIVSGFKVFTGITKGKIIEPPTYIKNIEMPYTEIFVPDGATEIYYKIKDTDQDYTYNHRYKAIKSLVEYINNL